MLSPFTRCEARATRRAFPPSRGRVGCPAPSFANARLVAEPQKSDRGDGYEEERHFGFPLGDLRTRRSLTTTCPLQAFARSLSATSADKRGLRRFALARPFTPETPPRPTRPSPRSAVGDSARPSPLPSYSQSLSPLKTLPSLPVETRRMDRLSTVER